MDLFDDACDQPVDAQKRVVAELSTSDPELSMRLAKLLQHDASGTDVLERAAGQEMLADEIRAARVLERLGQTSGEETGRVGARVNDYLVGEKLGAGGLGTVHLATDANGGTVAIKFLKSSATADDESVTRLRREFRAIKTLDHPGVLRVFEYGASPIGYFIVMEHIGGGDLRKLVGGDKVIIISVLSRVAEALAYVHENGIVHRDLKPANVLLTKDHPPQPKLADFGVAKMSDASAIITGSKAVMGSIDFMSPEQLRGRADKRSDMYAFGCMIHHLWCSAPPFTGDNFERLYGRMNGVAPSLRERAPDAPAPLIELTDRMLKRDPNDRPSSCSEIASALAMMRL